MDGVDMKLHKKKQLNEVRHMKGNFKYMNNKQLLAQIWLSPKRVLRLGENYRFVALLSQLESVKQEQSPHLTLPLNHIFSELPNHIL